MHGTVATISDIIVRMIVMAELILPMLIGVYVVTAVITVKGRNRNEHSNLAQRGRDFRKLRPSALGPTWQLLRS